VAEQVESYTSTVPVSYVKTFLEGIQVDQADLNCILERAGVSAKLLSMPDARMTQEQFSTLFQLLVVHVDDEMPGLYGRPLRRGTLKVLTILMLDAPNLQAALRRWHQFDHVLHDDFSFTIDRGADLTAIGINLYPPQARSARLVQELHLKLVHGISSWVIGKKIELERVDFAFARPPDASEYIFIFPGPVYFDQPNTAMYIKSSYLDAPVQHRSKLELRDFLFNAPQNWFFVPFNENILSHQVRKYLESHLHENSDMESVAQALNYSTRTLGRRLQEERTTFHQIKDGLRRDVAVQKLIKTGEPVDAIAAAIGFTSVTAFYRSFRIWTGGTPRSYRRRNTEGKTQ
jgi:AraC-like DNA-binding protein